MPDEVEFSQDGIGDYMVVWSCDQPAEGVRYRVMEEEWLESAVMPIRRITRVRVEGGG